MGNASELELNITWIDWANAYTNKRKTNEERWRMTPYDGKGGGGFVGWVDTGIAWRYDGTNEPSIAPTTLLRNRLTHKTLHYHRPTFCFSDEEDDIIHVVFVHFVNI